MPELPEVETARSLIEKNCIGRPITRVLARECGGGPRDGKFDNKIIGEGVSEAKLVAALRGRKVLAARRRGKQLWLEMSGGCDLGIGRNRRVYLAEELSGRGPAVLLHLGMTGSLAIQGGERLAYVRSKQKDDQWPPRYTKLLLHFRGGKQLAFADPRRFGKISLRKNPEEQPPLSLLAPDPVTDIVSLADFAAGLAASKLAVKALLLCQDRIVSGVGNWMADEMLYQARIHPAALACQLGKDQVKQLHTQLLGICRKACAVSADYKRFPSHWLFRHRWGKGKWSARLNAEEGGKVSGATLPDGSPIEFTVVGGRTTAFVPSRQGSAPRASGSRKKKRAAGASAEPVAAKRRRKRVT